MSTAVCTLFEGHYHLGAAALINSLHKGGFQGRMICGYRGNLPPWARGLRDAAHGCRVMDLSPGLEVWFLPLSAPVHFANYKPTFMLEIWKTVAEGCSTLFYLDPDIVVKCPWEVIDRWSWGGVALCEDVNPYLPPRHPLRLGWKRWLTETGGPACTRETDRYYSSGFLGVPVAHRGFLELWAGFIERIGETNGTLAQIKQGSPTELFHTPDQDAMNLAVMTSDVPLNTAGQEAMDFAVGGHMLSHAIGGRKPWLGGFIAQAIQGYPPSLAAKSFFAHTAGPLTVFPPLKSAGLRFSLTVGSLIGRFYRRA